MSMDSAAKLVVGIPLKDVDFKDNNLREMFYEGDELEDIERFICCDAQDFDEQLIGVELHSVEWGYTPVGFDSIKWLESVTKLREIMNNNTKDIRLYLVSSYF